MADESATTTVETQGDGIRKGIRERVWARYRKSLLRRLLSEYSGITGLALVTIVVILAIFSPQIAPYDPTGIDIPSKLESPSAKHPMGTDHLGRDLLSRLIFGARIALIVSIPAILFGMVFASILGTICGYSRGFLGSVILVAFDTVRSFPTILFAIAILAMSGGSSITTLIVVLGITRIPTFGRVVRAQTIRVRGNEYVLAAQSIGASTPRILIRHILPNAIGPVFIQGAMDIPVMITFEAALSFLGLGVQPPTPSWGAILQVGYDYIRTTPWIVIFGGLFLAVTTLGFTLLGEALRDNLDPRLRKDLQQS